MRQMRLDVKNRGIIHPAADYGQRQQFRKHGIKVSFARDDVGLGSLVTKLRCRGTDCRPVCGRIERKGSRRKSQRGFKPDAGVKI